MALIKYLETALLSFHDTWQQVMTLADEFKFRSVGGRSRTIMIEHTLIYFGRPLAGRLRSEITGPGLEVV